MSFNSRNNLAFADDSEIPQEDFLKVLAQACNIGWENIKKNIQNPCQYDNGKEVCGIESSNKHFILPEGKEIQLCAIHERLLRKRLGL